jgi:hypothetical protein
MMVKAKMVEGEERLEGLEEKNKGWELHGAIPVYRNNEVVKFSCSISAGELAEMYLVGKIIYNENVQRGTKLNPKGEKIEIFQMKKVKEIYEALKEDRLFGSVITLNANKDTNIEIIYDVETGTLSGDKPLEILDGFHRLKSFTRLLKDYTKGKKEAGSVDPFSWHIPTIIENLSEDDSCALFSEYSTKILKVSKSRSEFLNVYSAGNMIIRHLIKNSQMRGKIDCVNVGLKNDHVATFSTLSNAIKIYLKPRTVQEADNFKVYAIDFFNILTNIFPESFGDVSKEERKEVRSKSFVIEPLFMSAYILLLKNLIGQDDWEEKLSKLKDEVVVDDWKGSLLDRGNPYWVNNITRGQGKIVSTRSTGRFVTESIVNYVMHSTLKDKLE